LSNTSKPSPIRVLLADDQLRVHEAVTLALRGADDIVLVGQAANGDEAVVLCGQLMPDLVLMDVLMPRSGGIEATGRIHQRYPQVKILVLSAMQDDTTVRAMLEAGAVGYVLKDSLARDLAATIRATHAGNAVFSQGITDRLLQNNQPTPVSQGFNLTERELEVLRLMAEGLNNGELAARLHISQSTVKFHIVNILDKMGVATRPEAIVLAAKNNLV
jgi:DNA-binding NarL/FixJ family response regulator